MRYLNDPTRHRSRHNLRHSIEARQYTIPYDTNHLHEGMSVSKCIHFMGTKPFAVLKRLIGVLPSVMSMLSIPSAPSNRACIAGPIVDEGNANRYNGAPESITIILRTHH